MDEPKSAALQQVLALFDSLSEEDQVLFVNEVLRKPFKKSFEGHDSPSLLGLAARLLGLDALSAAAREMREYDTLIGQIQEMQNASFKRMSETADKAIALADGLRAELDRRTPKARHHERDREIVRLHDEEGKTFGQIPHMLLQMNASWCGKNGKQLTRSAKSDWLVNNLNLLRGVARPLCTKLVLSTGVYSGDLWCTVWTARRWSVAHMYGNVAEWCLDHYRDNSYDTFARDRLTLAPVNLPTADRYPDVVRGGSWADPADRCRSAARRASDRSWQRSDPDTRKSIWWLSDTDFVGFRVVRPVEEQENLRGQTSRVTRETK
jgi:hypothetical protein